MYNNHNALMVTLLYQAFFTALKTVIYVICIHILIALCICNFFSTVVVLFILLVL